MVRRSASRSCNGKCTSELRRGRSCFHRVVSREELDRFAREADVAKRSISLRRATFLVDDRAREEDRSFAEPICIVAAQLDRRRQNTQRRSFARPSRTVLRKHHRSGEAFRILRRADPILDHRRQEHPEGARGVDETDVSKVRVGQKPTSPPTPSATNSGGGCTRRAAVGPEERPHRRPTEKVDTKFSKPGGTRPGSQLPDGCAWMRSSAGGEGAQAQPGRF